VLHAGLVVDDHVGVVAAEAVDHLAQVVVDGAVAAGAFRAAHGDQVDAVAFGQRRADLAIQVVALVQAAGQRAHGRAAGCQRLLDLGQHVLADVAHRPFQRQAEDHVEVAGGIGVDGQDGAGLGLNQILDHHGGDGGLADSALAGESDGSGHGWLLLRTIRCSPQGRFAGSPVVCVTLR